MVASKFLMVLSLHTEVHLWEKQLPLTPVHSLVAVVCSRWSWEESQVKLWEGQTTFNMGTSGENQGRYITGRCLMISL